MASTVSSSVRLTANDEPTSDWTVEQLMEWNLLRSQKETDKKLNELVATLDQEFETGKAEILACHEQLLANDAEEQENQDNTTNGDPVKTTAEAAAAKPAKKRKIKPSLTIHVTVSAGPHAGTTHALKPLKRSPCPVGRSTGKKFKEKGMSLGKDCEVSTSHGKFHLGGDGNKAYFTDVGSSNGTFVNDSLELEPNVPYEVKDGMKFQLGATVFTVRLEYS